MLARSVARNSILVCVLLIQLRTKNQNYVDEYRHRIIHRLTPLPMDTPAAHTTPLTLNSSTPTPNRLPSPDPPRFLKLHTPPQRLLRLPLHLRILIRPRKPKPRLTIIPPPTKLRQAIQQAVRAITRRQSVEERKFCCGRRRAQRGRRR